MTRFIVAPEVFSALPGVCFGTLVVKNIDNNLPQPEISAILKEVQQELFQKLNGRKAKEYPPILPYREAFQALSINPNKYPPSIEALTARVEKGKELPSINPAVDLGNAISLKYGIPLGAHDLDSSAEDLYVRLSDPSDCFIPFGETEPETPDPGEILYVSGHQVKTRRWIWRQSEFGKVTAESKNLFFPLDGFEPINGEATKIARDELAKLLEKYFHTPPIVGWVNQENPIFEF